ncbi:MAG: glycosyltransferase family protein [Alphaproteobacteria bacterium]
MGPAGLRVLMYSHDTFGLGHLRRTSTIAHAITRAFADASTLIVSGSPIIGSFDFGPRVDFVRIPGVIKRRSGTYEALRLPFDIDETIALRRSILCHTVSAFRPDLIIVDKEPTGLRGEMLPALDLARERDIPVVLGVRDVLDAPDRVLADWTRRGSLDALETFYSHVWIYGLPQIHRPLERLPLGPIMGARITYTGYLRRGTWSDDTEDPFLLVTTGGGGDGDGLIDWALSAYESGADLPWPARIVMGPFLDPAVRSGFEARASGLPRVDTCVFDPTLDRTMARAAGTLAMGGYNTFCEILTHDRPAIIVPRMRPRLEQWLRAREAAALGLIRMLEDPVETGAARTRDPGPLVEALRALPDQPRPSARLVPGLLDGLATITDWIAQHILGDRSRASGAAP